MLGKRSQEKDVYIERKEEKEEARKEKLKE
jgi:hypothetical protein